MASPQTENGFLRVATELVEALARVNLSSYESRILWFVLRKTYGYGKKMDRIPRIQFWEGIGIKPQHISRAVKSLVDRQILIRDEPKPQFVLYGIQKNYEIWKPAPIQGVPIQGVPIEDQTCTYTGSKPAPIKGPSKERKKTIDSPVTGKPSPSSSDPRGKEFFDWWDREYRERFPDPYNFNGGKEGSLVKRLLRNYNLSRLQDLARRFLDSKDPWVQQKGGFTIGVFASQINKIISTTAASRRSEPKEYPT